jgi:CBS domain-containing protein
VRVEQAMTRDVITGSPDQPVAEVMGVLTEKRIRHLPIVENGRLIGMISIGDVVKSQYDALQFENHFLKSYIVG